MPDINSDIVLIQSLRSNNFDNSLNIVRWFEQSHMVIDKFVLDRADGLNSI